MKVRIDYEIEDDELALESVYKFLDARDHYPLSLKNLQVRVGKVYDEEEVWFDLLAPPVPAPETTVKDVTIGRVNITINREADIDDVIDRLGKVIGKKVIGQ